MLSSSGRAGLNQKTALGAHTASPRGAAGTPQEEFRSDSAGGIHSCFWGVFAGYLGVFGGIQGYSLSLGYCKLMGSTTSSKVGGGRFGVRDVGIYNIRGGEAMRPPGPPLLEF